MSRAKHSTFEEELEADNKRKENKRRRIELEEKSTEK